jgi:hypothetical protein
VHLLTEHQWAGGEILIESDDFLRLVIYEATDDSGTVIENRWANLLVLFGEDTLPTRRFDGTTVAATLPRVANDSRPVTVVMDTRTEAVGDVRAYGFAQLLQGPTVSGHAPQFPRGNPLPQILAQGSDALLVVDLRDMSTQRVLPYSDLPEDPRIYEQVGPGWSYRPDAAVIMRQLWQFLPVGTVQLLNPDPIVTGRVMVEYAPGKWFAASNHWTKFCCPWLDLWGDNFLYDIAISPSGDRVTPIGFGTYPLDPDIPGSPGGNRPGWPVFDGDGELLYAVAPSIWMLYGGVFAAFSPTGDTLYVAMPSELGSGHELQVVRAADGALLRTTWLESNVLGMTADPAGPWIYLPTIVHKGQAGWVVAIMVVDRRTLEVVGVPTAPDETTGGWWLDFLPAIVGDGAVYVSNQYTVADLFPYQLNSWRFDRMPLGVGSGGPARGNNPGQFVSSSTARRMSRD